jgi:hypothetical protein
MRHRRCDLPLQGIGSPYARSLRPDQRIDLPAVFKKKAWGRSTPVLSGVDFEQKLGFS